MKIKPLLLPFLLIALTSGCSTKNKDKESKQLDGFSSANILSATIDSVHQEILRGDYGLVDHFMLIHKGKLIANHHYEHDYDSMTPRSDKVDYPYIYDNPEWYPYYKDTDWHTLQSMTKSVTSILLGIALDENKEYSVNTKAMSLFKGFEINYKDPRKKDITIQDLLTMRSGLMWDETDYFVNPLNDADLMQKEDEWVSYILNKPTDTFPGTSEIIVRRFIHWTVSANQKK